MIILIIIAEFRFFFHIHIQNILINLLGIPLYPVKCFLPTIGQRTTVHISAIYLLYLCVAHTITHINEAAYLDALFSGLITGVGDASMLRYHRYNN